MRLRVLGGRRKTAALAESNLSPQQALTSTLTPPQPSWLSSQCRLQLLSPALQQSPVKPASSLEVSSRKWGRHLCGEMLTCSVGAAQGSPASPRAASSWAHASSSSVPAPSLAVLRQGQALCGSWLWPRARQPVGAGARPRSIVPVPCCTGPELPLWDSALLKWIFVLLHTPISVSSQ